MDVKLIGMKDFRQNLASYTKKAQSQGTTFIVLKKNVPVLKVSPVNEKDFALSLLQSDLKAARQQVSQGDTVPHDEILTEFGLQ